MKYKDDLANGCVNGYYVGKALGAKTPDALGEKTDDGYDNIRKTERFGTVLPDAANPGVPEPLNGGETEGGAG
ncbi:hypothetical protein ABEX25_23305 [Paenibacillus thiaminolyticus]|uniref:hypothetical protein n=1 Tax=Paenibacillus thiaminolyticus TaxID=49283 RepID=UPI003D273572